MKRAALTALLQLAWAAPALAQMDASMPGMSMPAKNKPAAETNAARARAKTKAAASSGPSRGSAPGKSASGPRAGQGMSSMPNMSMADVQAPATGNMPGMDMPHGSSGGQREPSIPQTPPPPPPRDHAADLYYDPALMAEARSGLRQENGGGIYAKVFANILEYQPTSQGGYRWDGEAWIGDDINRLWIKSEGEGSRREGLDSAEIQALYSRAVGRYTDFQVGVRYDFKPDPSRTYATVGFETIFPYMFKVEGALFLSNKGEFLARIEGFYDILLTQRLVLQPWVELNAAAQNSPDIGVGGGLSTAELGLRLRYEIRREFAPYIGVTYNQSLGTTADYARSTGKKTGAVRFVTGIRTWF